jgi:EAL domain-containing protein (putative c-di-GMP-specific phosphodiesterase class I)/GGDEF domain-containing protein
MQIARFLPEEMVHSRAGKIVLLGLLCLLLQQIPIPYRIDFFGNQDDASLIHLQAGVLLAIAMLDRDRWVLAGTYFITFLGWTVRQSSDEGGPSITLLWGLAVSTLGYVWTAACARWAGWPRPAETRRVRQADLVRFASAGLLLYPAGMAVLGASIVLLSTPQVALSDLFQTFFAKQFGVAVVTMPLVIVWCERGRPLSPMPKRGWWWPLLLCGVLAASLWTTVHVQETFTDARAPSIVLMDYRFALFIVLAWCVLRLPSRWSMLALSGALLLLVCAVAGTAEYGNSAIGFFNLLHIVLEVNILLMAMLYLWLINRDRRELAERLSDETRRDTVTGLPNLKALRLRMAQQPQRRAELGYLLLDQTDSLVAGFGLETQAAAMNAVARRLSDMVDSYYVGTGQFALLPRAAADDDLWEMLMARVEHAEIDADGQPVRLLPYLGIATFSGGRPEMFDAALQTASHLAFNARQHGEVRPRYSEVGDSLVRHSQRQQLQNAAEALACLRNERVVLYFQPILPLLAKDAVAGSAGSTPSSIIYGEVLCRLRSESGELIPPARFMGPIEAAGRGAELDLAVLRALFRQLRKYPESLPYCRQIAINLTGQSLASTSFQVELRTLLADAPLPMTSLCFEVTETAAISSTAAASQLLNDLRAKGCRIAIDDFGTGMQSFSRLKELPVDIIKIDGSFIRNVTARGSDFALVQASVAIAKAFGAETVAEFVEDEAIADCLRELGVQRVQGFLYSAPRPLSDVLTEVVPVLSKVAAIGYGH